MTFDLDFSFLPRYWLALLMALLTTLGSVVLAAFLGVFWGLALSLARTSGGKLLYCLSTVYVELFRGTPVLVQLFWIFFCLPIFLGIELSGFTSAIISLTLYSGAIISESFRAALKSIEKSQYDACEALGMSKLQELIFVVMPQAFLRATPNLLSNVVALFKESALVSAVGIADLMYVGENIANRIARPIEPLTTVALIYFTIAFPLTRVVSFLETRLLAVIRT